MLDKRNIVEVHDLKVHFPIRAGIFKSVKGTVKAVDGVDFEVRRGETLGLVGESGCGKSTIGRAMIRLREPTAGQVFFEGVDLGSLDSNASAGHAPAHADHLPGSLRLARPADDGRVDHQRAAGGPQPRSSKGAKRERVAELLRLVGLDPAFVSRYPHEFSGGQRQRIGVARALAVEPEFIVCDEPISALDVSIQAQVLNLLTDLRERLGLTYLFVAHDLSVVKHISDRVAVMYLGKIVEVGPPDQLYTTPGHPYTRALLSAVPVPDPNAERKRKRVILKGDVPSPVNPPPGCRFHTRCWLYERLGQPEDCRTVEPLLTVLEGEHRVACHHADEALKTDVGIAHIADRPVRHGTPAKAIASLAAQGIDLDAPKPEVLEAPVAEALDATLLTSTSPARGVPAPRGLLTAVAARGQPRRRPHVLVSRPGPRSRGRWAVLVVMLAVAACGTPVPPTAPAGNATPSPTPSPTVAPTPSPTPVPVPTLTVAIDGDLAGGFSNAATGADAIRVADFIHDGLYALDARLRPVPGAGGRPAARLGGRTDVDRRPAR